VSGSVGFETFVRDPHALREGEEQPLVLRDLSPGRRKYLARHAVGVISRNPAPGAVPLRMRSMVGNLVPGPHYVAIRRALPSRIPGLPYENAFDAIAAAWERTAATE
jgi:hypothetical protein